VAHILVVDDLNNVRMTLALQLSEAGHQVVEAEGGQAAIEALDKGVFDMVITDLRMGSVDGMEVLRAARRISPNTEVIVLTAYGTVESGVAAMKLGAFDYLTKPVKPEELALVVAHALEKARLGDRVKRLLPPGSLPFRAGQSRAWRAVMDKVEKVAPTDATVLLLGESGVGKEVVANIIHSMSRRREMPLLRINLGSVSETLQESELFGHVKGSFTGAVASRKGIFMEADGGTLFLDEVGEAAPSTQVAMLRVLAQHELRPVGGDRDMKVDVRVIAATNANLEDAVRAGRFREDLFFRINVFPIRVPALRERTEDIPALARHLMERHAAKLNRSVPELSADACVALQAYAWPGNVRELENVLERTLILAPGPVITADDLPLQEVASLRVPAQGNGGGGNGGHDVARSLAAVEREHILAVLEHCRGQKQRAAEVLDIARATLFRKLKEYGVT
jgi:two-component system response regulator HydG